MKNIAVLLCGPLVEPTRGVAQSIEPLFSQPPIESGIRISAYAGF